GVFGRGPSGLCLVKDSFIGTSWLAVWELPTRLTARQLRTCKRPGCGRVIAVKRQEHCIDCAKAVQKARVAAWRRRNAQRVRDLAHETYVRRKRRESGRRNLKIERRPRKG